MILPLNRFRSIMTTSLLMYVISPFAGISQDLYAQEQVELFGYFESTLLGSELDSRYFQLTTNKLRVDLKSDLSENLSFAANFDYITYHGQTRWNILDYLSRDIQSQVPEDQRGLFTTTFNDRTFLDNAYFKLSLKSIDITAGKQQISLGSGYVWNPTDIFNIKDPVDPTYEQPGHNAIRVDLPLGTRNNLSVLYSPEANWEQSGKLFRFKTRVSHFDIALLAIESQWIFYDYTRFNIDKMNFRELAQRRRLVGLSSAGELLGVGTWAEYAYNQMNHFKDFYELVVGGDYTFDSQTYLMLEFYRNTLGKSDYRKYDLNDWMRQFTGEQKAVSQDHLYALMQHPVTDFITLGSSFIYSISDNSLAIVPMLNYSLSENVDILAYLNTNTGKAGTAYGTNSGNGGLIRARIYF